MLSVVIMAHRQREAFVEELQAGELAGVEVVWDERGDRWDTGKRSLLSFAPEASHHLVIQDDAIPSKDLIKACERLVEASGDHPVGLYTGNVRPKQAEVKAGLHRARQKNSCWLEMVGPHWGVACIFATKFIPEMVEWCESQTTANYDKRVSNFFKSETDLKAWYTIPSLVDHRSIAENPSLVAGRHSDRRALNFIGTDRSGLEIDWSQTPSTTEVLMRHRQSGKRIKAEYGGFNWQRLSRTGAWEQIGETSP